MLPKKDFFNARLLLFQALGVASFIAISSMHYGTGPDRALVSFSVPILIGFVVGTLIGLMAAALQHKNRQEHQFFLSIIETLANSLDERDRYTHGHSRRVTNLCQALGHEIGLKAKDLELIRLGSILHDIGKIGVADSILLKPQTLTPEEFSSIKNHPAQGEHILLPMLHENRISRITHMVRHHHERYDGAGYPDGLKGEGIPFMARMISIADSFDAMTSDRPYRKGMTREKALKEIEKGSGTQFDPRLVQQFLAMMYRCEASECPNQSNCEVFKRILNEDISVAYKTQFCSGLYEYCARYKITNKHKLADNLLPDGSFL